MNGLNPSRNCRFDGCVRVCKSSGYCMPHYDQLYKRAHNTGTQEGVKLTEEQVSEIRRRSSRFQSNRAIGRAMGLSEKTVRKYLKKAKAT